MVTRLIKKKNFIAKDLFSRKYKPRIIKPKNEEVLRELKKLKSLRQIVE